MNKIINLILLGTNDKNIMLKQNYLIEEKI